MKNENKHYVYEHIRPDTGAVFYVGMGKLRRAWNMHQRNKHHKNVQKKLKNIGMYPEIRILKKNIPRQCAWAIERIIISLHGLENLTNQSTGGEKSCMGWIPDEEYRKKSSERMKEVSAQENWRKRKSEEMKIKHSDPLYRLNMSKKLKGKKKPEGFGEEVSRRCSKPIVCLNDGREWPSAVTAAKNYGLSGRNVSSVCTGNIPHTLGYVFSYQQDAAEKLKNFCPPIVKPAKRSVICFTNGKKYKSISDAARDLGISTGNVCGVLSGVNRHAKGHTFAYFDEGM